MILDPDTRLMLEFANGDIRAFEQIMNKYKKLVMNTAYRFLQDRSEAEDVTQEVFMKVYDSANSYSAKAKLSTWIYKITANLCLNVLRSQKRFTGISMETIGKTSTNTQANPVEEVEKVRMIRLVREAVGSLPDRQRMAVILQKYEGFSYLEISEIIGCSESAVDSLLQRAKQNLKSKLAPFLENKNEGFL